MSLLQDVFTVVDFSFFFQLHFKSKPFNIIKLDIKEKCDSDDGEKMYNTDKLRKNIKIFCLIYRMSGTYR